MKVFINSIPKSGTNLVQKVLHLAGIPYTGKSVAASSIFGRYALIKYMLRRPQINEVPVAIGLEVPVSVSRKWLIRYLQIPGGSYVSGHSAYSHHFAYLLQREQFKMIQVIRHPCAIVNSWANYIVTPGYYWKAASNAMRSLPFNERVRAISRGGELGTVFYPGIGEVLNKAEGWYRQDFVLSVRFEDLVGKKGGGSDDRQRETLMKIFAHINYKVPPKSLDKIQNELFGGTHTFRKGDNHEWAHVIDDKSKEILSAELSNSWIMEKFEYSMT